MQLVYLALGLVIGAVVTVLWLRGKSRGELAVLEERASGAEALKRALESKAAAYEDLRLEHERQKTAAERDLAAAHEKLALLQQAREQLARDFENLANRIFEERSAAGKASLKEVLDPLREQLGAFKRKVEEVYVAEGQQRATLLAQIEELKKLNNDIGREAKDLTLALKGESKTRGNWGELVVERVLELSGLHEGREYETQVCLKERHGGAQIRYPDFIVHLPEGRDVVIDAKVVLNDYEQYCNAEREDERPALLKNYIDAVRGRIHELSEKRYDELAGIKPLEQVIMCIPNESAYLTAVSEATRLHEYALDRQILLVGPNTLVLALKIVKAMWRNEDQTRNARQIAERGQLLYEKFVGFVEDLERVGEAIGKASNAFEQARNKLRTGRGNLVQQAQTLIGLGVKTKKDLPSDYAEKALEAGSETEGQGVVIRKA